MMSTPDATANHGAKLRPVNPPAKRPTPSSGTEKIRN